MLNVYGFGLDIQMLKEDIRLLSDPGYVSKLIASQIVKTDADDNISNKQNIEVLHFKGRSFFPVYRPYSLFF